MLDLAGFIFVAGYLAHILLLAVKRASHSDALGSAMAFLLVWTGLLLAIGRDAAHDSGPVGANVKMFALTLTLIASIWVFVPALRRAAVATPLRSLIWLNAWRLGGFFFLLLYAAGRLPWPFAPVAAIGDIITGAGAAYLALALWRGRQFNASIAGAWNVFGLLDLLLAVTLALLSTPGAPFQIFADAPAGSALSSLPWMLVPAAIVPALMFVHLAIGGRLHEKRRPIAGDPSQGMM